MKNQEQTQAFKKTPPYLSFPTFINAVQAIATHGVPKKIDKSVLRAFSGSNQNLLLQAFRSLDLIDETDKPTDLLLKLAVPNIQDQKAALVGILRRCYPGQFDHLKDGTIALLKSSFDDSGLEQSVKAKCLTFFLQAAKYAELEISGHILSGIRTRMPRGSNGVKRRKKSPEQEEEFDDLDESEEQDKVRVPVPIGLGKTWVVTMDRDYSDADIDRFVSVLKIVLAK